MKCNFLGNLESHVDAWVGEMPFQFPCSGSETLRYRIRSDETGPNQKQKEMIAELSERYELLWPNIVEKLIELRSSAGLSQPSASPMPRVLLSIPGIVNTEVFDLILGYEFENEAVAGTGYFACLNNWNVESIIKAG